MPTWGARSSTRACRRASTPSRRRPAAVRDLHGPRRLPPDRRHESAAPGRGLELGRPHEPRRPAGPGLGCDPDPITATASSPRPTGSWPSCRTGTPASSRSTSRDPARPTLMGAPTTGRMPTATRTRRNYDEARRLLFSADEDFCKTSGSGTEKGFGYLRVWDYSDLAAPEQIGEFSTPNASGSKDVNAGDYTIHNPLIVGTDALHLLVHGRHPRGRRPRPAEPEGGRVLRPAGGQQPGPALAARARSRTRPRSGASPTTRAATSSTRAT